jgi:hypothetical protein
VSKDQSRGAGARPSASPTAALSTNDKPTWNPHVEFANKATRDKLNDVVIAVLRDLHPGDLEAGADP